MLFPAAAMPPLPEENLLSPIAAAVVATQGICPPSQRKQRRQEHRGFLSDGPCGVPPVPRDVSRPGGSRGGPTDGRDRGGRVVLRWPSEGPPRTGRGRESGCFRPVRAKRAGLRLRRLQLFEGDPDGQDPATCRQGSGLLHR